MYKIKLTKSARKAYLKLPEEIRTMIYHKLNILAESPFTGYNNVKNLKGITNRFRLRVRNWRVIYKIYNDLSIIEVIKIAHRKEAYR